MTTASLAGFSRAGLDSLEPERMLPHADVLNAQALADQQRRLGVPVPAASGPVLVAATLLSTTRKLTEAVEAQALAQQRVREATSALHALGGAAETQAAYERSLALGEDVQPPASREQQAARVRGLQTLADEAAARVANLSQQATGHRRALAAALMPQALAAYQDAAKALAACYADILVLQTQGASIVMLNGNPMRVPSAAGLPEPGGAGILVSTGTVVDSGQLGVAERRIEAEVQRLLSLLKQQEAQS